MTMMPVGAHGAGDVVDQSANAREIALPLVVGRHVGRDVDDIASRQSLALMRKALVRSVGRQQFRQTRLDDRQGSALERGDQRMVGIVADRRKALGRDRRRRNEAKVRHAGKTDGGPVHAVASFASRRSVRWIVRSLLRSVGVRASQSFLKCSYSSAQVGSSCVSVTAVSGGLPLGSTRRR
jgi:hypothetical protein